MKNKKVLIIGLAALIIVDVLLLYFSLTKKDDNRNKDNNHNNINSDIPITNKKLNEIRLDNLVFEYDSDILLSDILEIEIEGQLDTQKLGENTKEIITNDNKYIINYKITDTIAPIILGSTTKTTTKGKKINLVNKFMCGDNYDDRPNCYIEGDYDFDTVGTYNLKYIAKDSSGNKTTKNFKLKVKEPSKSSGSSSSTSTPIKKTSISKYIKKYKKENTKVGIDVSAWQDNIDWKKAKKAGVEFAMIRIGYGPTSDNEIKEDKWFKNNIKEAKKVGIPVGIYLYSYAKTKEDAIEQVKWINNKLNGEKLELPIAFDWENWNSFNKYKVSFKKLNDIAKTFIEEANKYGYEGMLYSSAYYLNHIWKEYDNTWVAYYTSNNDFSKPYIMWQLSSKGGVDGISGPVDIDILYENKNEH